LFSSARDGLITAGFEVIINQIKIYNMKKLMLSVLAIALMTIVVFASGVFKKADSCPKGPGCTCSKSTTTQVAAQPKSDCPSRPGCVCAH
jgi:hypothetical protein